MTTAHRPTWAPAKGGEEQGGNRLFVASRAMSAKDQPGHTKLKFRQLGQSRQDEVQNRDLKTELELKEAKHFAKKIDFEEERKKDMLLLTGSLDTGGGGKAPKPLIPRAYDADESDAESSSSDSDSDDEDDEEELLAELERIKKERAEEAARKAQDEAEQLAKQKEQELVRGNPLISSLVEPTFSIKRRWDDDVVFKNQSRGEPVAKKRFINDTIRNDFHRRFLHRYIR